MDLTVEKKAKIFDVLFKEYVEEHGLGGMTKSDLDALLLWLVASESDAINTFDLSTSFKIKESRVRSLLETAAVKFDTGKSGDAWKKILALLVEVEFDIESLEKGQIRFQLRNPMLFRWIQNAVRELGSTCSYNRASEQVTMNLDTMYRLLNWLCDGDDTVEDKAWSKPITKDAQSKVHRIVESVGKNIETNSLEDLRERKRPKLAKAIEVGASLTAIGGAVKPLYSAIVG